ncbi:peptide ABC transporter permease [Brevirhabdus pacifica]|uniref:Peptide ABC transporter permease n=1 Tax=Brevirhabdus pacifica TaxID=1267768 RepID=A0A1U7DHJ4_9RHOB|nr:DMT family transporter [Brevirhabdus pacifica]APX89405.1 peptide ABC transporter permease [Brevirhabdus pacifica]OWU76570.1 peptide ABC transporter permease [Loktanella sp. 22II-4b]PJJ85956.1 EamA-like transporter family protein [Brevirhabdus pacifica]
MTLLVFFAVLGAALLHASWNAIVKTGASKQSAMLVLTVGHALIGVIIAAFNPWPQPHVWPWLLASGLIHTTYQLLLAVAYEQGDLSRVYPLARGAAPLLVLVAGAVLLADTIAPAEVAGILVLGAGIVLMARGVFRNGESRRMVPFALGSALATAAYSMVDGTGARISGNAVSYVGWLLIFSAVFFVPVQVAIKGPSVLRMAPSALGWGLLASAMSYLAYAIAVWAMTQAPIALVTALRETSILFAVLIGWIAFGERMDRQKAIAAALILAGVVITRL